jgi:hypothetical protein
VVGRRRLARIVRKGECDARPAPRGAHGRLDGGDGRVLEVLKDGGERRGGGHRRRGGRARRRAPLAAAVVADPDRARLVAPAPHNLRPSVGWVKDEAPPGRGRRQRHVSDVDEAEARLGAEVAGGRCSNIVRRLGAEEHQVAAAVAKGRPGREAREGRASAREDGHGTDGRKRLERGPDLVGRRGDGEKGCRGAGKLEGERASERGRRRCVRKEREGDVDGREGDWGGADGKEAGVRRAGGEGEREGDGPRSGGSGGGGGGGGCPVLLQHRN